MDGPRFVVRPYQLKKGVVYGVFDRDKEAWVSYSNNRDQNASKALADKLNSGAVKNYKWFVKFENGQTKSIR